jgi:hypothetical protein
MEHQRKEKESKLLIQLGKMEKDEKKWKQVLPLSKT